MIKFFFKKAIITIYQDTNGLNKWARFFVKDVNIKAEIINLFSTLKNIYMNQKRFVLLLKLMMYKKAQN